MKIINITHNDLDGVGAPIVLSSLYSKVKLITHYCSYHDVEDTVGNVLNNLKGVSKVYITDISFRKESNLAEKIEKINKKYYDKNGEYLIELYDHHATSAYLNEYGWAKSKELDENGKETCGTAWIYKELKNGFSFNKTLDEFVNLVNMYDTWRWVNDYPVDKPLYEARDLNMLYGIMGKREFFEHFTKRIKLGKELFSNSDRNLLKYKLNEIAGDVLKKDKELITTDFVYETKSENLSFIERYLKNNGAKLGDMSYLLNKDYKKTFKVGICFCSRNISDVGNELCKNNKELDFIILINLPKTVSFRSVKQLEVPLGIIAQYATGSGGGHPQSAGGVLSDKVISMLIEDIFGE